MKFPDFSRFYKKIPGFSEAKISSIPPILTLVIQSKINVDVNFLSYITIFSISVHEKQISLHISLYSNTPLYERPLYEFPL